MQSGLGEKPKVCAMYCNKCGKSNPQESAFCSTCGAAVQSTMPSQLALSPGQTTTTTGIEVDHDGADRTSVAKALLLKKKPILTIVALPVVAILIYFVYNNVGYIPFHNAAMAPATVVVGVAQDVLNIHPGDTQNVYFWLYGNHARFFETSVSYPDGYHYLRRFSLIIGPGYSENINIVNAPAPTMTLENDSMGEPSFQVVDISSGVITDKTVEDAIQSGADSTYTAGTSLTLQYGHAYDVTADSTYSETEYYVVKGAIVPEPGYTYKVLTCGETGVRGENCGAFQYKNQDGGWYDSSSP